jgi:hypothetical protein
MVDRLLGRMKPGQEAGQEKGHVMTDQPTDTH